MKHHSHIYSSADNLNILQNGMREEALGHHRNGFTILLASKLCVL
jgi:hypothetical protein